MPEFRYTVIDTKGQTVSGTMEADNIEDCSRIIKQRGLYCIELAPASIATRSLNFGKKQKFDVKQLSLFCRQFSTMLNSGIGVIKSLDILYNQAEKPELKAILKKVYESVQRGQSLSTSLNAQDGAFPDLLINMVESGETSGTLDGVLGRLADTFEKNVKTGNKLKSAMMYPIILGILTVLVVIILMVFVMPTFVKMFQTAGAKLPLPTLILVGLSNSLINFWYIYIVVIVSAILIWINWLKVEANRLKWDTYKTKMPKVGKLLVIIITSRFARTISTLMKSGITLVKSLEITAKVVGNKYFEKRIMEVREEILTGISLSGALKKINIFPVMLLSMITIGEESGNLEDVLHKTSSFYDEESDSAITKMVGLLEPLMIVVMAGIVGFIVVSIILPMFGMMQVAGGK